MLKMIESHRGDEEELGLFSAIVAGVSGTIIGAALSSIYFNRKFQHEMKQVYNEREANVVGFNRAALEMGEDRQALARAYRAYLGEVERLRKDGISIPPMNFENYKQKMRFDELRNVMRLFDVSS